MVYAEESSYNSGTISLVFFATSPQICGGGTTFHPPALQNIIAPPGDLRRGRGFRSGFYPPRQPCVGVFLRYRRKYPCTSGKYFLRAAGRAGRAGSGVFCVSGWISTGAAFVAP